MQRNAEKCREMQRNVGKYREIQINAEKGREMLGNAEKCREMQRNVEKCREMKRNVEKCREILRNAEGVSTARGSIRLCCLSTVSSQATESSVMLETTWLKKCLPSRSGAPNILATMTMKRRHFIHFWELCWACGTSSDWNFAWVAFSMVASFLLP